MSGGDHSDGVRPGAGVILPGGMHAPIPRVDKGGRGEDALLNSLLNLLPDAMFLTEGRGLRIRRANPALCRMLGLSAERLCATGLSAHLAERQDALPRQLRAAVLSGAGFGPRQLALRRSDGTRLPVTISADPAGGFGDAALAWVRVVPAAPQPAAGDVHGERVDSLTGLGNRKDLLRRLRAEIEVARAQGRMGAVVLVDLDGSGEINARYGKAAGDEFISLQAHRLRGAMAEGDYAARLGGDEFAAILTDVATPRAAKIRALDISAALSARAEIGGATITGGASVGVSLFPLDSDDPDLLLLNADAGLYAAKRAGGGMVVFYKPSAAALYPVTWRDRARSDLARAQRNDELSLRFQPIVDLTSGQTVLFEALMRWHQPGARQLVPEEFTRLAESNSANDTLRRFSIDSALHHQAQWERRVGKAGVCVNISPAQLASDAAMEWILDRVGRMRERDALVLEVTETTRFREDAQFERLATLRRAGVRIAIDDFGTGHSTLDHLARIPADFLKLDRRFVAGIGEEKYLRLLRAAISLGKEFGLRIIAEGIETKSQADALRNLGCDMGQGFLIGAPMREARQGKRV